MESRKNRMSVGGLRRADPTTLMVLTQDVLRLPLGQIDPPTLLDLMALSEVPDQLPSALAKELSKFRAQMIREIADLPDGPPLVDFARDLQKAPASQAPACVRVAIDELVPERRHLDAVAALEQLVEYWKTEGPTDVALPSEQESRRRTGAAAPPPRKVLQPVKEPRKRRTTTGTPAPMVDDRREEWVRDDVMSRLVNYGSRGLKEPVIVAGSRHRSPWKDMAEGEVLAVLRKMKREGLLRYSAGRWMVNR